MVNIFLTQIICLSKEVPKLIKSLCFGSPLLPCPPLSASSLLGESAQVSCVEMMVDGSHPWMWFGPHPGLGSFGQVVS